ncbi:MAG: hypothetical protein CVU05_05645 [Bacteroidetes bacterium HGW-Bacteroidetes-21]|jgi:hypothetical protein|nr:MAG: hypothetical protein CVU05_05645 [Bacteroidetes bacterium HGW-Bacteroidetes-21]
MRIVTLISDWKKADYYAAVIRGIVMSADENVNVVEISDQIDSYRIEQAALVLSNCYQFYPAGTIHLVAVKGEPEINNRFLLAEWESQYFLFSDNGFASLFWPDELPEKLYELKEQPVTTFPEADILARVAVDLLNKKEPAEFALPTRENLRRLHPQPSFDQDVIMGTVLLNDSYGNAITNVSKNYFEKHVQNKNYVIIPGNNHYPIRKIQSRYNEVSPAGQTAVFNSAGKLEIAIRNGSARDLLGLKEGTNIRIEIYDTANS